MSGVDQESARLKEAIERYASGETSFESCRAICDSLSGLLEIEGVDEELALEKGLEVAVPFFERAIRGDVPSPHDTRAGAALSRALAILAIFHWSIGGRFKRRACVDAVSQGLGIEGAVPVFSWTGPSEAELGAFVLEGADKIIAVFRGRKMLSHEVLLCTDYRLEEDGRLRLWAEKTCLLPKREGLTLDEAMCITHAIYFRGLDEKLRKLATALLPPASSLSNGVPLDASIRKTEARRIATSVAVP